MSNVAFYLKYRPQSLDDLVGQDEVKKTLLSAFSSHKLSHAYLFVGTRGTGKTSTARILAKMVNCRAEQGAPCNKCSNCTSITDGSSLDLIEIDAASNRGIEDIRALRDKIKLSPSSSKKKVYIIDEVHMLTPEAFNALLKTLEEPPSHALFILATTDAKKLPQTILSRVQRLDFKNASSKELLEALEKIVKIEKIDIEKPALDLLVKKAEGSFRDGIKLLDQLNSQGEKITTKLLQDSLKSTSAEVISELVQAFAKKDAKNSLLLILKQVEMGADIKELILSLMDTFRNIFFIKNGLAGQPDLEKIAKDFTSQDLVKILDVLQGALEKLKFASIQSLPLELAVVEICSGSGISYVSEPKSLEPEKVQPDIVLELQTQTSPSISDAIPNDAPDILKIKEKWTFVLETIRPFNFSLEALLRSINIKECTQTDVILEVRYSFHQRILEAPKNRDLLESILSDILGRVIRISTVLGVRIQRGEDIANIEVAADDEIIRAAAEIFNSDTVN